MQVKLNELEDALINEEFFVEYQPIMGIDGKECLGAEALIRWQRGEEVIPPLDFIPVIENTPLSGLFTYWLIERISQELGEWLRRQDHLFISINVPPELLGRGGLMYVASKCGLLDLAEKIVLEVTERGLPDNLGLQGLREGKKRGFQVCLDDVGATNENLLIYSRANVDLIKLDKSIADEMLESDWTEDKINGLKAFTQSTNIKVIAEGIETEFQRDLFQKLGVQMGQGWYFSYPLSAERFSEFYRASITGD
ncbi:MAG: EAL domain-containing protein [Campylobacterota bacterium]|nr:EAL domain-containing protein [Campylobacterota bacterium]